MKLAGLPKLSRKVELKKIYSGLSSKMNILFKSFSANFTKLLADALQEDTLTHIGHFFTKG